MNTNIKMLIDELHRAFYLFNKHYYNNKLPEPAILIQNRGNKKNVLGWCSVNKIWKNNMNNERKWEINLVAEYMNRGLFPIMGTLLHEMAHLYNLSNNIQDVSRNGTYHNKKFKETAENAGLIIEHDKRIGWSITRLNNECMKFIKDNGFSEEVFTLSRLEPLEAYKSGDDDEEGNIIEKPKQSTRKYICPTCGTIVRATKDVKIICGECNIDFVLE